MKHPSLRSRVCAAVAAVALSASLVACSNDDDSNDSNNAATTSNNSSSADNSSESQGEWPRTIHHELGETVIEKQPTNIANTALSLTGTLLAIGAPVKYSAATNPSELTNDQGFFTQWADIADEKGVQVLYPGLEFDLESLIAADPDLVIISTAGADSVKDQYEEISELFPTVAYDYSDGDWQDIAKQLGEATGLEDEAQAAIDDFDSYVQDAAGKINVPDGGATIVSFNGPGKSQGIGKKSGAQGKLLEQLGFEIEEAPADLDESPQAREDFSFVSMENLSQAIKGDTVFLLSATDEDVEAFLNDPVLANLPAVQKQQVYALGLTSFRIDPYSGREMVDAVVNQLGN